MSNPGQAVWTGIAVAFCLQRLRYPHPYGLSSCRDQAEYNPGNGGLASYPAKRIGKKCWQNLGEPDTVSKDGSRFGYYSTKYKWLIIVAAPAPAGAMDTVRNQQVFSILFDSRGVVLEKGVQARPGARGDPGRLIGVAEDSMGRRIEEYVPFSRKERPGGQFFYGSRMFRFHFSNPGQSVFRCPAGMLIITPEDESFARYLRSAFISELERVKAFSPQGNPSLAVHLDKIGYSISSRPNDLAPGFGGTLESMVKEGYLGLSSSSIHQTAGLW